MCRVVVRERHTGKFAISSENNRLCEVVMCFWKSKETQLVAQLQACVYFFCIECRNCYNLLMHHQQLFVWSLFQMRTCQPPGAGCSQLPAEQVYRKRCCSQCLEKCIPCARGLGTNYLLCEYSGMIQPFFVSLWKRITRDYEEPLIITRIASKGFSLLVCQTLPFILREPLPHWLPSVDAFFFFISVTFAQYVHSW